MSSQASVLGPHGLVHEIMARYVERSVTDSFALVMKYWQVWWTKDGYSHEQQEASKMHDGAVQIIWWHGIQMINSFFVFLTNFS